MKQITFSKCPACGGKIVSTERIERRGTHTELILDPETDMVGTGPNDAPYNQDEERTDILFWCGECHIEEWQIVEMLLAEATK